jgi:hypothetical protein
VIAARGSYSITHIESRHRRIMVPPGDEGAQMATLYERLGGRDAIAAVVDSVVAR